VALASPPLRDARDTHGILCPSATCARAMALSRSTPLTTMKDDHGALVLHFSSHTRVAGEALHGQVDLDFTKLQAQRIQQLRVKLRGSAQACGSDPETFHYPLMTCYVCRIINGPGPLGSTPGMTCRHTISLICTDTVLWEEGTAYPHPDTHMLSIPFAFVLPRDLPPSFHCVSEDAKTTGTVSYSIEVVGDRPGLFRSNRRLGVVFPVVPPASDAQVNARMRLPSGWDGDWRATATQADVRPRPWGPYGHVVATFELPALKSYPIGTPIPYRLRVTTRTRVVEHCHVPDDGNKSLFPALPTDPARLREIYT
jgi:hypothetical protein